MNFGKGCARSTESILKASSRNMQLKATIEKMSSSTRPMMSTTSRELFWLIWSPELSMEFKMVFIRTYTILRTFMSLSMEAALETTGPMVSIAVIMKVFRLLRGWKMSWWNLGNDWSRGRGFRLSGGILDVPLNSWRHWVRPGILFTRETERSIPKESHINILSVSQHGGWRGSLTLQLHAHS